MEGLRWGGYDYFPLGIHPKYPVWQNRGGGWVDWTLKGGGDPLKTTQTALFPADFSKLFPQLLALHCHAPPCPQEIELLGHL